MSHNHACASTNLCRSNLFICGTVALSKKIPYQNSHDSDGLVIWLQELGGNSWWFDRFLAQHMAFFYYIMTVLMYALSPRMACKYLHLDFAGYELSCIITSHSFDPLES